jgi:hypothetical protein
MAVPSTEINVLDDGIEQDSPSKGSFALNMLYRRNAWEARKGFGQVCQRTTTFGLPTGVAGTLARGMGMRKHLGSYMLKTDFGHTQCLSIFSALVRTGNALTNADMTNSYTDYVIVAEIDDITTGDHWEEPLYTHTSEATGFGSEGATSMNMWGSKITTNYSGSPPPYWKGQYSTNMSSDRTAFKSGLTEDAFFFHEQEDTLYFGSPAVGIFVYRPIIIGKTERRSLTYDITSYDSDPYAERSFVRPLVPTPNPAYESAYTYLNKATFPGSPVDVAVMDGRLVVAADRTLFFSDPNQPGYFVGINQVSVPSRTPITAIEPHYGHLMIFTEDETFMFRSSGGALYGGGQVSKVDEHVGCYGPNAITVAKGSLIWSDKNGVYSTTGNLVVTKISQGIDDFFNGYFSSPLTSYYTTTTSPGFSNTANEQPQTQFVVSGVNAHLCYNPELESLFAVYPESEAIFCFAGGKWSLWTTETQATNTANKVIATQTITNAWVLSSEDRLVMVGSLDEQTLDDSAKTASGGDVDQDLAVTSYYLLEYGRGGSLDRSVCDGEDMRKPTGYYTYTPASGRAVFYHCKVGVPERVPTGYAFPNGSWTIGGTTYTTTRPEDVIYWVPVSVLVSNPAYTKMNKWQATVAYDHNAWEPVMYANNSDIDFVVPSARIVTKPGYNPGAGNATAKVINAGASGVQIKFDRTEDPSTRYIYLAPLVPSVMVYIPMRLKEASQASSLSRMIESVSSASATSSAGTITLAPWVWKEYFIGTTQSRNSNNVAMPVDWAYKTKQVNMNGQSMLKARGLFVRLSSRGPGDADSNLVPNFLFGMFNTLLGCDEKGWVSQVVDYDGVSNVNSESLDKIAKKNSIRTRVRNSGAMVDKVFDQAGVTYGANGSTTAGNYLIDDQAVSVISTSDSVKGSTFSYMMFGHIQNRAQAIRIEDAKATVRVSGSRRRTGK